MTLRSTKPISPEVDPRAFSISAVIDWVALRITLRTPTNPQTLRRWWRKTMRVPAPYFQAVNGSMNRTSVTFEFRVQDPASPAAVESIVEALAQEFPLAEPVTIFGVEVALDARAKVAGASVPAMAEHMFQFHAELVDDWRVPGEEGTTGDVERPTTRSELLATFETGRTIFVGPRDASCIQRFYFKSTDRRGRLPLDVADHRARCEVRLLRELAPFTTFDEWRAFDFTSLKRFFAFRELHPSVTKVRRNLWRQIVRPAPNRHRPSDRHLADKLARETRGRKFSTATRADVALNARAYDALRNLTARQRPPANIPGRDAPQASDFARSGATDLNTLSTSPAHTSNLGTTSVTASSSVKRSHHPHRPERAHEVLVKGPPGATLTVRKTRARKKLPDPYT